MVNNHIQPHDRLFRGLMSKPKVAKDFFEQHLPDNIKQIANLDKLKLQKGSFVNDKLRLQITDMLYKSEFNGKIGYLYLLVEHQTKEDPWMPLRLLKYMIAIMERHIQTTKSKTLPIVYPLLFYSGKNKHKSSTDILDLFGSQRSLAENILWNPCQLIDLSTIPDDQLKQSLWVGVMSRVMKHIYKKDILPFVKIILNELRLIEKEGDLDYIYKILSYWVEAGEIKDEQKFQETIKKGLSNIEEERIMTLAKKWHQQGRREMQQQTAKKLLARGMQVKQVAEITELPLKAVKNLKPIDE